MSRSFNSSLPFDVCLLLRADAEQSWLRREVIPVLQHLETPGQLPEERVEAALAYLEVVWNEATARARETDAAHAQLVRGDGEHDGLSGPASHYHTAVRALRDALATRVSALLESPSERFSDRPEATPEMLWAANGCGASANGHARRTV